MAALLWHRVAALAAPLWFAAPVLAQLDAEACFRLYYGAGPTRDLTRARACFEKEVPKRTCNQTPYHLDRLYLAVMYLDGQGGAAEPGKARALLSDCVNEIHAQRVRDLRELFRYRLHPKNNAAALAGAMRALAERCRQQLERAQRAQEAWTAYRDATPAFYCEALKSGDCRAVTTDLLTTLTERRIDDLK